MNGTPSSTGTGQPTAARPRTGPVWVDLLGTALVAWTALNGLFTSSIASRLFLSEATVKTHVSRVLEKLGVRDRVQAVVAAYETGLVRPGS